MEERGVGEGSPLKGKPILEALHEHGMRRFWDNLRANREMAESEGLLRLDKSDLLQELKRSHFERLLYASALAGFFGVERERRNRIESDVPQFPLKPGEKTRVLNLYPPDAPFLLRQFVMGMNYARPLRSETWNRRLSRAPGKLRDAVVARAKTGELRDRQALGALLRSIRFHVNEEMRGLLEKPIVISKDGRRVHQSIEQELSGKMSAAYALGGQLRRDPAYNPFVTRLRVPWTLASLTRRRRRSSTRRRRLP